MLALVTLLGAGVLGSGPQQADGSEAPVGPTAGPTPERDATAASRSDERAPLSAGPVPTKDAVPSPTDEAAAEPLPEIVPAPDAEPEPEPLPDVTGQMWTTDAVNVRTAPSADAEKVTTASFATAVDVTGAVEDGWNQVVWEGAAAWISADFLSDSEPEPEPEAGEQAASAAGTSLAPCSVNPEIESSLQSNATATYRSVCASFPQVTSYGGIRPGDSGDHGTGRAVDIMITGETGWEIARYLQANAGSLGITYVIYQQQRWMAGDATSSWIPMEDRGSTTANHYDHVHVSTS
ncbi:SH3 domain-containing protein [Cellulosimicrobium arenosum]|uniref:SH3 domain-containing protein n=1 Tax=Cellulosimicrobium arenosum TaxID=2708133 RepID=A0A927PCF3_9MICO|nr:SH3 domain-containing protein [Cellulosimicrobium arenosum]